MVGAAVGGSVLGSDERLDRRVVVIDDDEWRRRGIVDGLRELGGALAVHAALTHRQALQFGPWSQVDVVILDASGAVGGWDRFAGLEVAEAIRAVSPTPTPVVVLVADVDNSLLVVRAAEAGVDFVYRRCDVRTIEELELLALAPDSSHTPARIADFEALRQLGVSFSSRLNAGLEFLADSGYAVELGRGVLPHLTCRRSITLRQRLVQIVGIRGIGGGGATGVQASIPSWRQLIEIIDLARGASSS